MNKLWNKRLVTPDGIMHIPFDCDGDGVVLVCDYEDKELDYDDLRRFPATALVEPDPVTCLGCLAADDVFNKRKDGDIDVMRDWPPLGG